MCCCTELATFVVLARTSFSSAYMPVDTAFIPANALETTWIFQQFVFQDEGERIIYRRMIVAAFLGPTPAFKIVH